MKKHDRHQYIQSSSPIEAELLSVFDSKDNLVILDIGSCEGEDSIRYSRLFPHSVIYAFEPLPANYERIREHIKKYECTNISIVTGALGGEVGEADFYVSSGAPPEKENDENWDFGNKSSSLYKPDQALVETPWLKFDTCIKVPVDTLENFCKENSVEKVDFIHLDVQGAELDVLRGAGRFLDNVSLVWMEVEAVALYENQPLKSEVEEFMHENGFILVKNTVKRKAGDQLYLKGHLRDLLPTQVSLLERMKSRIWKK
jgi:2-O-methyltransferase